MERTIEIRKKKLQTRDYCYIALFAAIISVCAWISIPMTVPFTLQTFAVFVTVGLLGCKRGTLTVLVYIALGAIGVPVFSGFTGGIGALFGKTGGYILGFLLTAVVGGILVDKFGKSTKCLAAAMTVGLILCYLFGSLWFMAVYTAGTEGGIGLVSVLSMCVIPFILPDLVKMAVAILLVKGLSKHMRL